MEDNTRDENNESALKDKQIFFLNNKDKTKRKGKNTT